MIPGQQKWFKRQPSEYEASLKKQVDELREQLSALAESWRTDLDELRREMLGYIKPEPEVTEEPSVNGFQTFTRRRAAAATQAAQAPIRKVAKKTEEVLKQEQANG